MSETTTQESITQESTTPEEEHPGLVSKTTTQESTTTMEEPHESADGSNQSESGAIWGLIVFILLLGVLTFVAVKFILSRRRRAWGGTSADQGGSHVHFSIEAKEIDSHEIPIHIFSEQVKNKLIPRDSEFANLCKIDFQRNVLVLSRNIGESYNNYSGISLNRHAHSI